MSIDLKLVWKLDLEEPYYLTIKDAHGDRIAEIVCLDDAFPLSEEPNVRALAKARLMTSAPQMFAALQKAKSIVGAAAASADSTAVRAARQKVYEEVVAAIADASRG